MHALIVDDSRAMRRILRQIVEPLGFVVVEACHGKDGLEQMNHHPDTELALIDWNMPEMNGFEMVKILRADPANRKLKIVMVTTETEPAKMARALMAGVDEFLMKPFTPEMLLDKLQLIGVAMPTTA